jgi:hypothetical protein
MILKSWVTTPDLKKKKMEKWKKLLLDKRKSATIIQDSLTNREMSSVQVNKRKP